MANRVEPEPERQRARPGPSPSVSVEDIVQAAVGIADAQGLASVTMRSVATRVGLSAPGLYRHVASREELLGLMVDRISGQVAHPTPTGDWVGDFTRVARQQVELFGAHSWMVEAVGSLRSLGPQVLEHLEWGLAVLSGVEAPTRDKLEAIAMVNGLATIFATPAPTLGPQAFASLDAARHARLTEALTNADDTEPSQDLLERAIEALLHSLLG